MKNKKNTKAIKKVDFQKIFDRFVGDGKVQSTSLSKCDDDLWEWKFKEGTKHSSITSDDLEFLQKMHVEFGGKNPDTCRASDKFLKLTDFTLEDLLVAGHRPTKIVLVGQRIRDNDIYPIPIPEKAGSKDILNSQKSDDADTLRVVRKDREDAAITRAFGSLEEFELFRRFILDHEITKRMTWYVRMLNTESKQTRDACVWKREKVGDGTRRMALELWALNGKHYTECLRADLFAAADDMFDSPCNRIDMKKEKEYITKTICGYAAEDGKVDIDGYEPA